VAQLPADLAEAVAGIYDQVMPEAPFDYRAALTRPAVDTYRSLFAKAVDGIRAVGRFREPEQWRYDCECSYTRDMWLDQMPTQGAFTRLSPDQLAEVLDGTGAAIDAIGGSFTVAYATVAVTAVRAD
jgi:hypothetical protein